MRGGHVFGEQRQQGSGMGKQHKAEFGSNEGAAHSPRGRVCAVIAAGGVGSRLGHPGGKQLMEVAGKPLVSWSLLAFDQARSVGHIVLVCPSERQAEMRAAVEPLGLATPVTFAAAGETRQASTCAGVEAAPDGFDIVAIHDGARPLIRPAVIDRAVAALIASPAAKRNAEAAAGAVAEEKSAVAGLPAEGVAAASRARGADAAVSASVMSEGCANGGARLGCSALAGAGFAYDGVVCGQPSVDTLKETEGDGLIAGTPDRARFWTVQTPQIFPISVMRRAFEEAERTGFTGTDDASLVERAGGRVLLFNTPRDNLKATVPEDLPLIEALLRMR